jgi:hypothetical protein
MTLPALEVEDPSGSWDRQLSKRISAVDEEPGVQRGRFGDAPQHLPTSLGVPSVECANPYGEHKIEWLFAVLQDKLLGRDAMADAVAAYLTTVASS